MPLIRPVPLVPPGELGGVHFIGVGGAGMSGIAALYAALGVPTSGSDQAASPTLDALAGAGVRTFVGHDSGHLGSAQTIVVSSAVRETNPELSEARRRGLRVWHRSAALGALMLGHHGVAVSGTHGKTTTSGMVAAVLLAAGADPGYVIGAPLANSGVSSALGAGPFVVEADESDGSFLQYPAEIVVVTNIEADHLDNWRTDDAYAAGMAEFATGSDVRTVIACLDDPGSRRLVEQLRAEGRAVVGYGTSPDAEIRVRPLPDLPGNDAELIAADDAGTFTLAVPGAHNVLNALAAYAVGREMGLSGPQLRAALGAFRGTHRRFEQVADVGGVRIVDDYAHHPTELAATLTAAREVTTGRIVACFQPHLFTRTRDYADDFGVSLQGADEVVVMDIYPAREDPIPGVSGELVAEAARRHVGADRVHYVPAKTDVPGVLAEIVRPGDLVLTLGAGDVTGVGPALASKLRGRA